MAIHPKEGIEMTDLLDLSDFQGNCLLHASDVARRLRISRSMAYRILKQGEIPTVRIGTAVRVREVDLLAYIQKHWSGWRNDS